jgi:hypothetical protein
MIKLTQRDKRWASELLGKSKCTCYQFGCVITSIAMFSDWYKDYKNPGILARTLSYTKDGLLIWSSIGNVFSKLQFKWRFFSHDKKLITDALSSKNDTVLLNVDRGKHWVAALYHIPLVGYRCTDPWVGYDRTYTYSEVSGGALLTRKM